MARGIAFSEIVLQLRAELRRSQSPAVGSEDLPPLKQTINHIVDVLSLEHDWPFMYRKFDPMALTAGVQFYNLPTGLLQERIIGARSKWGGSFYDLTRGITFDDYETWDPAEDERSSPALKYDFQNRAGALQIEVWPLPDSSTQSFYFEGYASHPRLVNDTDLCLFDDSVVVLFAAAELMADANKAESNAKRDQANELMRQIKIRGARNDGAPVQVGLGSGRTKPESGRAVVRISGS